MKKTVLNIEGMTCSACSLGLEKYLNKQHGIINASVNLVMATASIEHEDEITKKDLERFVKEAGFKSIGEESLTGAKNNSLCLIIIFSILSAFLMYISMGSMIGLYIPEVLDKMVSTQTYIFIIITITCLFIIWGFDIIKDGIKNILHGMPNMNSLIGIGVIVNFVYSLYNVLLINKGQIEYIHNLYFESSAMIILFVKIGRFIDKRNKYKAVDSIRNLVTVTPKSGNVLKDGKEVLTPLNEIGKGDIIICRPGEKIAVDGVVVNGITHIDESFLTGESKPVKKEAGSLVMAGSINYEGYIEYKAEKIGKDSSISHIVDMVVEATNTKSHITRIADKISRHFVLVIFLIAILSFVANVIITKDFSRAITALVSVLVVACPCALGLATPLAMVVSVGNCSKNGLIIKSSETLEKLNNVDTVVFDKTGTLTKGELEIVDGEYTNDNLKILQSLESKSNHPIAKGICKNTNDLLEVNNFEEILGKGIKGNIDGKTYYAGNRKFVEEMKIDDAFCDLASKYSQKGESIVYLWDDEKILAIIGLADEIKNGMSSVIANLKSLSKTCVMLTGDNEIVANQIAKKLDMDRVYGNVSPEGKLERIRKENTNQNCAMVGDGINDSPALKASAVGIGVSNGSDISSDSADVIMMNDDMNKIYDLFLIGKKTMRIIKENLFWALFYNVCMIPLATGLLPIKINPMVASLAMTLSSLTVVINSLRLRK